MASLLRSFGDTKTADRLKKDAAEMAKRFEKAFWMPQRGFYAMALDAEKRPLEVISSNPGHLLFTRIIGKARSRTIANRMMQEDMVSGWDGPTISRAEGLISPFVYHR